MNKIGGYVKENTRFEKIFGTADTVIPWRLMLMLGITFAIYISANTVAGKLVQIGPFILNSATIFYALTFWCTDAVNEVWGKRLAIKTMFIGIGIQLVSLAVYIGAVSLPPAPFFEHQAAYEIVLGAVPRILFASFITSGFTQVLDIYIFSKMKEKQGETGLWIRNNVSTFLAQVANTIVFQFLAFAGTMSWRDMLIMMGTVQLIKTILALAETPLIYVIVAWLKKDVTEGGFTNEYNEHLAG